MMVLSMLSWWYTAGWARLGKRVSVRISTMLETFSVGLLARTFFTPFRQISAGAQGKGMDAQLRALGDRAFSRVFGAFIRSIFIVLGLLAALLMVLVGLVQLVLWPLVPLAPLIGLGLTLSGWKP